MKVKLLVVIKTTTKSLLKEVSFGNLSCNGQGFEGKNRLRHDGLQAALQDADGDIEKAIEELRKSSS